MSVPQLDVVLLAVVVALHLLDVAVAVISPLARMNAVTETEITIVETAVIVPAAQKIGKKTCQSSILVLEYQTLTRNQGTVMSRKNVTVTVMRFARMAQMAKTGKVILRFRTVPRTKLADTQPAVALDSPPQTHDELDTAE